MAFPLFQNSKSTGVGQFWVGLLSAIGASVLMAMVVGVVMGVALFTVSGHPLAEQVVMTLGTGTVLAYAAYTQLAVAIKRCHAVGRSGWWCLLMLVPLVGPLWLLLDLSTRPLAQSSSPTA